jgi:S-adenosylmethionine/arginine decarboxylase-like enzyme
MTERAPWGYHAMFDVHGCDKAAITSAEVVREFTKALVKAIDMKAYGEPQIVDFANHDPNKGGFTLVQLIETSNICGHFVSATGDAYFDIFSCKEFDVGEASKVINDYFKPENGFVKFLFRDAHIDYQAEFVEQ